MTLPRVRSRLPLPGFVALVAWLVLTPTAWAQDDEGETPPEGELILDEITVSAQKREENLQETYRGDLDFSNPVRFPGAFPLGQGQDLDVSFWSQELRFASADGGRGQPTGLPHPGRRDFRGWRAQIL